jgi:hypothetical protein
MFVSKIGYNSRQEPEALMKEHGGTGPRIYCFSMPVLRIRIRCLFDPGIWDPGWVKSQDADPGSGMNNQDNIS